MAQVEHQFSSGRKYRLKPVTFAELASGRLDGEVLVEDATGKETEVVAFANCERKGNSLFFSLRTADWSRSLGTKVFEDPATLVDRSGRWRIKGRIES